MQDYRYDRVNSLAAHEAARQDLAAKMAAFEAENGPVQTLPILTDDKRVPFRLSCPEKKQKQLSDTQAKERSRSKLNEDRIRVGAANRERILALSNCNLTTKAIAERTGLSINVVQRVFKEARDAAKEKEL